MNVDADIEIMNRHPPKHAQLSVEERSIRRRIDKLPPMFVDAGQLGTERAGRKYTPVGRGIQTYDGLETIERMGRVEMHDWEMDLFAILDEPDIPGTFDATTLKAAKEAPRTARCTITIGIDIFTRCILALNVIPHKPSTMGSRAAPDSMSVDKTAWAKHAKAETDWPCGRSRGRSPPMAVPPSRGISATTSDVSASVRTEDYPQRSRVWFEPAGLPRRPGCARGGGIVLGFGCSE